jgi:hypothetical protein
MVATKDRNRLPGAERPEAPKRQHPNHPHHLLHEIGEKKPAGRYVYGCPSPAERGEGG